MHREVQIKQFPTIHTDSLRHETSGLCQKTNSIYIVLPLITQQRRSDLRARVLRCVRILGWLSLSAALAQIKPERGRITHLEAREPSYHLDVAVYKR